MESATSGATAHRVQGESGEGVVAPTAGPHHLEESRSEQEPRPGLGDHLSHSLLESLLRVILQSDLLLNQGSNPLSGGIVIAEFGGFSGPNPPTRGIRNETPV